MSRRSAVCAKIARRNGDAIDRLDRSPRPAAGEGPGRAAREGGVRTFGKGTARGLGTPWRPVSADRRRRPGDVAVGAAGRVGCRFSYRPRHERHADRRPSALPDAQGPGREAKRRRNVGCGTPRLYRLGSAGVALRDRQQRPVAPRGVPAAQAALCSGGGRFRARNGLGPRRRGGPRHGLGLGPVLCRRARLLDPPQSGCPASKRPARTPWDWAGKTTIITPTDPAAGISRA